MDKGEAEATPKHVFIAVENVEYEITNVMEKLEYLDRMSAN
jgi:hypothetical protein